ncbi:MAG: phage tail protein [Pseudomonadota bacterium]
MMITSLFAAAMLSVTASAATAQDQDEFPMLLTSAQPFTLNPSRADPYRNFNFRVIWDGRIVSGVHYVSPLRLRTEPIEYRDGGDREAVRSVPGLTTYAAVTLRRGLTHAPEFQEWADQVSRRGQRRNLSNFRKAVRIEILNQEGSVAHAFNMFGCWPSEYIPISGLNALRDSMAEETMTLVCDAWERDRAVTEPAPRRK